MPIPVPSWAEDIFPDSKSLNMALYTSDGTADNPAGIAFLACRPLLFESGTAAGTYPSLTAGTQSVLSTAAGTYASSLVVVDNAGYYGQTSDLPGKGYYQYQSVIEGAAGDGVTPGGWTVVSHFAPIRGTSTQTSVSADLVQVGGSSEPGTRQAPAGSAGSVTTPFFCDLENAGTSVWRPAVTIRDSSSTATSLAVNTTDSSGQTPRFAAVWSAVSATTAGQALFTAGGSYEWPAPAGVTSVTVAETGAGAGGGAGNVSPGGVEFGGGGAGGGEFAQDTVAVTGGNNYPVTVGTGGGGGAEPGGNGAAGGNSAFSGDSATVTAHGGSLGTGATASADGTAGAGGTGSGAATHHDGGAGAAGSTAKYGGGAGSSAGPGAAGNTATTAAGAPAPSGGGPGGPGGTVAIGVVQSATGQFAGTTSLTVKFRSPVQAGNTVIACVYAQGTTLTNPATCKLTDSTPMTSQVSQVFNSHDNSYATGIYTASGVLGGETGMTATVSGAGGNLAILVQMWEFTGLGASPGVDVTQSATGNPGATYNVSALTSAAPDVWIGTAASQNINGFNINAPAAAWTALPQTGDSNNGVFGRIRSGYQIKNAAGTMQYKGTMSDSHSWQALAAAFTATPATPGAAPLIPPGGGGGAGLGAFNGGNGADGQVELTWVSPSGSGYGTPALPTPYPSWSSATRLGTAGDAGTDVDLNSSSGITAVVNFLCNPPVFKVSATSAQSIPNTTLTAWAAASGTEAVDNYSGGTAGTYTVQRDGLYLFHGLVSYSANSTGARVAGATVNGTTYWGPGYKAATSGTTNASKTQIFSLQAGDTVQLACWQNSGGALALDTTSPTRFFLTWLCAPGVPAATWTPPDTTFRWAAGTPGAALGPLFAQHVGNDLGFLVNRPYVLAYQTAAQPSLTVAAWSTVTLDTAAGIVHGDTGDNYAGWTPGTSNLYTAPASGWYLVAGEFLSASSSSAGARVTAGILPVTSGGAAPSVTPDFYQVNSATSTAAAGGGATIIGVQYLLAGETITPQIRADSFASAYSTLTGTNNSGTTASHWEAVWISE